MIRKIKNFINFIRYCNIKRRLFFLKQLWTEGWCTYELWSLDFHFALYVVPKLKRLRKDIDEWTSYNLLIPEGLNCKEWSLILDRIISGFEEFIESDGCTLKENFVSAKKYSKDKDEMIPDYMLLFRKYYFHLLQVGL